ncbi:MAG: hypothetical protein QNK23_15335 [Crocinitomicaceae bacterium]|nr:hypothetical protein [Crocinitomicaceae bacterium]
MKRKIIRYSILTVVLAIVIGGSYGAYVWFMPHRDVQATPVDYTIEATQLVNEYLEDPTKANDKYLQEEGDSKIIAVTGSIISIETDMNDQKVLLLRNEDEEAGVSCTFTAETNANAEKLQIGDQVTIKGVIRSGASYDEDLEMYEDVIIEKCDVLQ